MRTAWTLAAALVLGPAAWAAETPPPDPESPAAEGQDAAEAAPETAFEERRFEEELAERRRERRENWEHMLGGPAPPEPFTGVGDAHERPDRPLAAD